MIKIINDYYYKYSKFKKYYSTHPKFENFNRLFIKIIILIYIYTNKIIFIKLIKILLIIKL